MSKDITDNSTFLGENPRCAICKKEIQAGELVEQKWIGVVQSVKNPYYNVNLDELLKPELADELENYVVDVPEYELAIVDGICKQTHSNCERQ